MMNHIFWNTGKKIGIFLALIILSFPIMGQRPIRLSSILPHPTPGNLQPISTIHKLTPSPPSTTPNKKSPFIFWEKSRGYSNGVLIRTLPSLKADIPVTIPPLGVVNLNGEEIAGLYNDATSDDLEIIGIPPRNSMSMECCLKVNMFGVSTPTNLITITSHCHQDVQCHSPFIMAISSTSSLLMKMK